ncbi:hypothetical protein SAMN05421747_10930 [Parapedobacter composti]|uniref:Uncharacterized protein n=1 Tax=Parapedobacter composti TaxID=623281 RepID=A0A1I1INH6_9SPHI|nr:hypothetical protein SAMN05421747_10930 [Parapedobacter composti]
MENHYKRLTFLIFSLLTFGLRDVCAQLSLQVDESRNFVYFYSDSVLYANRVRMRTDMLNQLVLKADSRRIPLRQVKFLNTDEGFFATTRRLPGLAKEQLSERVVEGRINIFQERPDQLLGPSETV